MRLFLNTNAKSSPKIKIDSYFHSYLQIPYLGKFTFKLILFYSVYMGQQRQGEKYIAIFSLIS